jgi:hypothetical protein
MRAVRSSALRFDFGETRLDDARAPSASSKLFLQAFPNLGCFAPSFSKHFLGGFVGFHWVASLPNPKCPSPNFRPSTGSKSRSRAVQPVGRVEGSSKYASTDRVFQKDNSAPLMLRRIAVQPPGSVDALSTSMVLAGGFAASVAYGVGVASPMSVSTTLASGNRAVISSVPPSAST